MSSIFGGSKSSQTASSSNQAYPFLQQQFGGLTGQATTGANAIQALLSGDASGFNAYKNATGFDALTEQGSRGITGNAAASGLLRSGGTGKALSNYGNQMQNQFADQYLNRLMGQAQLGMGAGQLLAGAGQQSQSTGKSNSKNGGLGGFLGNAAGAIAKSDRRTKVDIKKVSTLSDDLPVYSFRYKDDPSGELQLGVMADEVKDIRPDALGPIVDGYQTVDYSKIWNQL